MNLWPQSTRAMTAMLGIGLGAHAAIAGVTISFDFDAVAPGSIANNVPEVVSSPVRFYNSVLLPDLDDFGDPIPGTDRWRIDADAPAVIVDNPDAYGRGPAPSPLNALEALFQPVMLRFDSPFDIDLDGFSLVLDNDTFGANGHLPGWSDVAVRFYGVNSDLIASIPVDQTTPGYVVSAGGYAGVSYALLPAGAFYDNVEITGIPEPASAVLLAAGLALSRRRR